MKYQNKEIKTYFPAENVAGMYIVTEDDEQHLLSFGEFTELINQSSTKEVKE